ncbi:GPO family capsid scaffolding protein [Dickeya oryzae]|uniref:GPO family capsid scaffolding protein n=1 Tax=Dickeya oryzae TaxID=1240404 RepID=UPI001AEC83E6|nr:GPO family capsid scaffolding protein [Dickeya oryzae]MBP2844082.1 GPO family capsid scaffolding protein [Dickeya oryzae]
MAAKANARRFRIGVEGATTDGRTIERAWLEQMAANYDPAVYTALINMEHIKGYTPDSPFRRYGKVEALETEEIQDGLLSGKLALYAYLAPTDDLIALTQKGQKLFTSMEVNPDFADTGSAYLVGLAVTDDPASLGTEMLTFSAGARQNPLAARKQSPGNLFTAAEETPLVFEPDDNKPSLFSRISALFAKKQTSDDARFSDVHQAVELVAQEQQQLAAQVQQHSAQLARLASLETDLQAHKTELASLKETLSQQDRNSSIRPLSTGGADTATVLTDC